MIKFGTGGWRAVIAEDFTFSNVRRVAKGTALYLKEIGQAHKPVVIGHDLRFLSGRFSRALLRQRTKVFLSGSLNVVPTPMLMYSRQEKLQWGL